MPKVSYIVSAYDRPILMRCCLASLAAQTDHDFEAIVADNSPDFKTQAVNRAVVDGMLDSRFSHIDTDSIKTCRGWDCYHSAEYVARNWATGEWLCFPSDDSYYVPMFQEAMVNKAQINGWSMVYCDWLCDRRGSLNGEGPGRYGWVDASARISRIDKTGFMVRSSSFGAFPGKNMEEVKPCAADGLFIEELVRRGAKHGKVNEVLMVHN